MKHKTLLDYAREQVEAGNDHPMAVVSDLWGDPDGQDMTWADVAKFLETLPDFDGRIDGEWGDHYGPTLPDDYDPDDGPIFMARPHKVYKLNYWNNWEVLLDHEAHLADI